jgi:hypothetical protein
MIRNLRPVLLEHGRRIRIDLREPRRTHARALEAQREAADPRETNRRPLARIDPRFPGEASELVALAKLSVEQTMLARVFPGAHDLKVC